MQRVHHTTHIANPHTFARQNTRHLHVQHTTRWSCAAHSHRTLVHFSLAHQHFRIDHPYMFAVAPRLRNAAERPESRRRDGSVWHNPPVTVIISWAVRRPWLPRRRQQSPVQLLQLRTQESQSDTWPSTQPRTDTRGLGCNCDFIPVFYSRPREPVNFTPSRIRSWTVAR